jgi:AcrR family transcriptional regulator
MTDAILDAARANMREHGPAGLNLNEVARMVSVRTPALYNYFPSKMALYDALFLMGTRIARTYLEPAFEIPGPFLETLHAGLEAYMRFAQEHPELYQLCFERPVPGFVPSEESMEESRAGLATFDRRIARAVAEGEIRADLSYTQARDVIVAMSHGLTAQHMANEPHLPVGSGRYGGLIRAAARVLLAGLSPEKNVEEGGNPP